MFCLSAPGKIALLSARQTFTAGPQIVLNPLTLSKAVLRPLAGVAESVLARVLDAFQARMAAALGGSAVQGLAGNAALARLMAAEPAAGQAGDPVAFFAGRGGDSIDAFVTEVVNAGGLWVPDRFCRSRNLAFPRHPVALFAGRTGNSIDTFVAELDIAGAPASGVAACHPQARPTP